MKNTINTAIARASYQNLCASSIEPKHELAAIGIETLDLVIELEATVMDLNNLAIDVCDDAWPSWVSVGDVYRFYGVK